MSKFTLFPVRCSILKSFTLSAALFSFGLLWQSCEPSAAPQPIVPKDYVKQPVAEDTTNTIQLTDSAAVDAPEEIVKLGTAEFFTDSFTVNGVGFSLAKHTDYAVIRILFDDDGNIRKVENLSDLPFTRVDKNTIFLKRGANLTRISRHFGIPIQRLLDCNPQITNPNRLQALTRLKLNCSECTK